MTRFRFSGPYAPSLYTVQKNNDKKLKKKKNPTYLPILFIYLFIYLFIFEHITSNIFFFALSLIFFWKFSKWNVLKFEIKCFIITVFIYSNKYVKQNAKRMGIGVPFILHGGGYIFLQKREVVGKIIEEWRLLREST